ncbi:MAG: PTS system mannose/fructose/sorbose family transporter subunit IID [Bacillota bacterium]
MSAKEARVEKKLTNGDLFKVWAIWCSFLHGMYNYRNMQGVGVCHSMIPVINRLYDTKEERVEALKRHLVFFNSNTTTGTIAAGIMASMEEQKANGAPLTGEMINSVKASLMGPLAGLGDSIWQGMLIPILVALGISMGLQGNVAGPIVFSVLILGITYPLMWWWFKAAYKQGGQLIGSLTESGLLQTAMSAVNFVGLMAAGALTAKYINFGLVAEIAIGDMPAVNIQTAVLDQLIPNLLPLLLVLGVWHLLRKGKKVNHIIFALFGIGIVLGYFNIIG